jgi:uncharacterized membrane protein
MSPRTRSPRAWRRSGRRTSATCSASRRCSSPGSTITACSRGRNARTGLLFTNGLLLLVVALVPFPTALLGAYLASPGASVVCAIYAAPIGLLNLTYNVLWWEVERHQPGYTGVLNYTYQLLWWGVVRRQPRTKQPQGWRPPTSMLLSYLGFPCYMVAVGIAFWSPVATRVICGTLWLVWSIMAPMLSTD